MILSDKEKFLVAGIYIELIKELAFAIDKICVDISDRGHKDYNKVLEDIEEQLLEFQEERKAGIDRTHYNDEAEKPEFTFNSFKDKKDKKDKKVKKDKKAKKTKKSPKIKKDKGE
jgi:hypothetical protein